MPNKIPRPTTAKQSKKAIKRTVPLMTLLHPPVGTCLRHVMGAKTLIHSQLQSHHGTINQIPDSPVSNHYMPKAHVPTALSLNLYRLSLPFREGPGVGFFFLQGGAGADKKSIRRDDGGCLMGCALPFRGKAYLSAAMALSSATVKSQPFCTAGMWQRSRGECTSFNVGP